MEGPEESAGGGGASGLGPNGPGACSLPGVHSSFTSNRPLRPVLSITGRPNCWVRKLIMVANATADRHQMGQRLDRHEDRQRRRALPVPDRLHGEEHLDREAPAEPEDSGLRTSSFSAHPSRQLVHKRADLWFPYEP